MPTASYTVTIHAPDAQAAAAIAETARKLGAFVKTGDVTEAPRLRLTSLTTAERDNLSDVTRGEIIHNKTIDAVQVYLIGGWTTI